MIPKNHERILKNIIRDTERALYRLAHEIANDKLTYAEGVTRAFHEHKTIIAKWGADPIKPLQEGAVLDNIRKSFNFMIPRIQARRPFVGRIESIKPL